MYASNISQDELCPKMVTATTYKLNTQNLVHLFVNISFVNTILALSIFGQAWVVHKN